MELKIDPVANAMNIELFQKYGTHDPYEYRHICVLCGENTCIDDSYSNRGDRLICWKCNRTKFPDALAAMRWIGDD
jgi:hypothetical protein